MSARRLAVGLCAAVVLLAACQPADQPPLPESMAALGDSITTGVLAGGETHSWATGTEVASHHQRLVDAGAELDGRVRNLSRPGARMGDAPDQARRAVATGADYVTVLFGGNDVCAPAVGDMTPADEFEASFAETLDILATGLPGARVLVASVPDVHRLWELLRDQPRARLTWRITGVCAALLAEERTAAQRQEVAARTEAYNDALNRVCGQAPRCRFDGGAVHAHRFETAEVSDIDFFHPSAAGQERLAEITWQAGYWP